MQPVRLTSTRYVRVMGYKIGALQHLSRYLLEEYLHRWNIGQSPILVHAVLPIQMKATCTATSTARVLTVVRMGTNLTHQ